MLSVLAVLLGCAGERKACSDRSCPSRPLCCSIMQPNYNPRFAWTYFIVIWKKYDRMLCIYLQGNLDQTQTSCELCWKPHGHSDTRLALYWQCQWSDLPAPNLNLAGHQLTISTHQQSTSSSSSSYTALHFRKCSTRINTSFSHTLMLSSVKLMTVCSIVERHCQVLLFWAKLTILSTSQLSFYELKI